MNQQLSFFPEPEDFRPPVTVTWNGWHGCDPASTGCLHCYMIRRDREYGKDPSFVHKTANFNLPVRSCRAYKPDHIEDEKLNAIMEARTYAATGMGKQSPIILAVKDPEVRAKLSRINAEVMGMEIDPFYGAPDLLVVLANKDIPTYIYDGSLVMGNMMNAAADLGVATCWIHRAKEEFESEEGKAI